MNPTEGNAKYPSRVLDDSLHFQDRLFRCLHKRHSAFRAFAHDFSEAIFIRDRDDEAAVQRVLESKGVDWNYAIRAKSDAMHRRIRRYIPPPSILVKRLKTLFNAYRDIVCSIQRQTKQSKRFTQERPVPAVFFSKSAREEAESLLETARCGFLSDPPDIPLFYKMGRDKDGLTIYRTIRGTSSVEGGVHMTIRRVFGSLQASPELSESLLINWIGRHNRKVITFHCCLLVLS